MCQCKRSINISVAEELGVKLGTLFTTIEKQKLNLNREETVSSPVTNPWIKQFRKRKWPENEVMIDSDVDGRRTLKGDWDSL